MRLGFALLLPLTAATLVAGRVPEIPDAAADRRGATTFVWSPDGSRFVWRESDKLWLFDSGNKHELLDSSSLKGAATAVPKPEAFGWVNRGVVEQPVQWFPDGKRLLVSEAGDLFLFDAASRKWEQLTRTARAEADPKLSPDGSRVAFRAGHELYTMEVASRKVTRLTHDATATRWNGELDWVYPEELQIPTAYWWSPDSRRIAYLQFDVGNLMLYPHAGLTELRPVPESQRYPQAGTSNAVVRLGVVGAAGGKTRWLEFPRGAESLIARVTWLPGSASLAVHLLSRVQDQLTVLEVPAGTGKHRVLVSESAPTWINLRDDFRFLSASPRLVWGSERDSGYRHLYLRPFDGGEARPLTRGEWEVTELACVDEKAGLAYYVSTEASPRERHLYRVPLDGGTPAKLTTEPGWHVISMPADCSRFIDTWSSATDPGSKALHRADGTKVAEIVPQDRKALEEFDLRRTEFLEFRGADGTLFHARLIKPAGFHPSRKYPAIVMVYGGPHAQNVKDQWRGADWDQVLAHRGFVIWQVDNRGSAGRGHVFEKQLYRRFGRQELADQLEGVRHLVSLGFVDPQRIGIYGWSYGGFMTLYSLFNAPGTFAAGISGAPPTDWRQYDTIYTERYLGLPQQNEQGYRASSVVFQAANLRDKLLLVHNFEDDNVLFQHSLRMIDALQKAGKQFEFMLYPQKAHGVTGSARKHMLDAMTTFFVRNLQGR
jgi:dipeptidyl-peptidase-4